MLDIKKILNERKIPDALIMNSGKRVETVSDFEFRRAEIKKILEEEVYGRILPRPDHLDVETVSIDKAFCAGKARLEKSEFICSFGENKFSFPVTAVIPKSKAPVPAFALIDFCPDVPNKFLPIEEIVDRGFAVFSFCYTNIASADGNFKNGAAKYILKTRRTKSAAGKSALWAFGAMRIMDYIERLDIIDKNNVAAVGHSTLGISALIAGCFDERFKYIISNESGTLGAAISRGKSGETPENSVIESPYLFCPRLKDNIIKRKRLPFDQNFLSVLAVPRHLMIGSACGDIQADPESEFLSLASTNEAYALYEKRGLVYGDEIPYAKAILDRGDALYHIRHGLHYFSREDWNVYMDYIDKVKKK